MSKVVINRKTLVSGAGTTRIGPKTIMGLLCIGFFTTYKGIQANRIILLNSDGDASTSFNSGTGFDSFLQDVETYNNKLYIIGDFTTYNGQPYNRIIRLNLDGGIDTTFNPGTGFNGLARAMIIQSDGKILVGGSFTSYNGTSANYIVRLNQDGSIDNTFNYGTGFSGALQGLTAVQDIAIDNNDKIYITGGFTTYNGSGGNNGIIRLNQDGSKDVAFDNSTGFNHYGTTIQVDKTTNKLYAGGYWSTYKGSSQLRIVRLNEDGSKDTSFNIGGGFTSSPFNPEGITIDSNGKVLLTGRFVLYDGNTENRILRLNDDGTKDNSFNNTTGFNNTAVGSVIDSLNRIYVGGAFTTYKGVTSNRIIRLNSDGSIDTSFNIGVGFDSTLSGRNLLLL
jgi:uncharacterized delta-60 repeat protein